ncbi:MAG: hypothetical protein IJ861_08370 [Clostridia bacterium]|nr:hypothetical protein [Clostridia bacterium]
MNEPYEVYRDHPGGKPDECEKNAKHYVDICVPIDVKPEAHVGKVEMECCGEPVIMCDDGKPDNVCRLILEQKICIKIPVRYTFKADVGKTIAECCAPCNK